CSCQAEASRWLGERAAVVLSAGAGHRSKRNETMQFQGTFCRGDKNLQVSGHVTGAHGTFTYTMTRGVKALQPGPGTILTNNGEIWKVKILRTDTTGGSPIAQSTFRILSRSP